MMKEKLQLSKWINGQLSEDEAKNIPDLALFKKIKDYSADLQTPSYNKEKVKQRINSAKKNKSNLSIYIKVAASIALILGIGSSLFFMGNSSINTKNSLSNIILPDQSNVHIQGKASLSYNSYFWFLNRVVELRGKAFFEVEKGKRFTVNTQHGKIEVLGTKFSVESDSTNFKVMCFEGEVAVYFDNQKKLLQPNKSVEIDLVNKKINQKNFNYNQPIWINDEVKFNAIALQDLISLISEQFSIEVDYSTLQNPSAFTGTLVFNNLQESLSVIASTYSIDIKQINKNNYIFVDNEMQ